MLGPRTPTSLALLASTALACSAGAGGGGGAGDPGGGGIRASSAALADVQAAVDRAGEGDTVLVPAGAATWGDGGAALAIDKAITLQGAGRGATVITISPSASAWTQGIVRLGAAATVRGLTVRTPATGGSGTAFSAGADGFRITDVEYVG